MRQEIEIIRLLRSGSGYTSGQELSEALGVSRTAVWKHMNALKKLGYSIEASPSKGYRLTGERPFNEIEIASALSTGFVGRELHFLSETASTNLKAFELGRAGAPEGAVVVADGQTMGKGRIGRRWESPPGRNLYASILLRPPVAPQDAQGLTFLMAVAAAETVEAASGVRPAVKWPNDIQIGGLKAAGILLEMDSEPDRVHFVVAGIGVNLNIRRSDFPDYIRDTATSLLDETGGPVDRAAFASLLFSGVEKWYKLYLTRGFVPVLDAWKGYFDGKGRVLRASSFRSSVTGVCEGVDASGALLLRTASGALERVISGDVEAADASGR